MITSWLARLTSPRPSTRDLAYSRRISDGRPACPGLQAGHGTQSDEFRFWFSLVRFGFGGVFGEVCLGLGSGLDFGCVCVCVCSLWCPVLMLLTRSADFYHPHWPTLCDEGSKGWRGPVASASLWDKRMLIGLFDGRGRRTGGRSEVQAILRNASNVCGCHTCTG